MGPRSPADDLPPELAFASSALTETSTIFDVMLDSESVSPLEVPGWAENLQRLTDSINRGPRDRELRRACTRVAFLQDLTHEVAAAARTAGVAEADCVEWLDDCSDQSIGAMSSLGLFRELLHEKLLDPATSWEENDLVDLMYLSCGAAYSDCVVSERSLGAHLQRGLERLGRQRG